MVGIAAMLGRNRAPEREPWPADAPDISVMRRILALSEGRPVPRVTDVISGDEYRRLIAAARAGKRTKAGGRG